MEKKTEAARTVAQIKNESKAKQLARLEAASLKKRKPSDPDELSSETCGGPGAGVLSKKQVPFARYRACTESTRKDLEGKKHAAWCHPVKNQNSEADAVSSGLRGKSEAPSPKVNWRGGKVEQRQPELLEDGQKAPRHEVIGDTVVESKEQMLEENRQQTVTFEGFQGNIHISKHALKTKTSVPHELPTHLCPLSKAEEEFVHRLNEDSPLRARYFICC